jgi:hypothetical protein
MSSQSLWPTGWSTASRLSRIISNLETGTMKPTLPLGGRCSAGGTVRPRTLNQTSCIQFPDAWQDGQSTGAWLVKEIAVEGDLAGKAALLRFDSIGFAVRACVNGTDCGCGHSGYPPSSWTSPRH